MAESFETFKLGGKGYTLDQLRKMRDTELRSLIGMPQTQKQLAQQASEQIQKRTQPTISAPAKQPVGTTGPRVRAREASGESSTVPAPAKKPPAPSPVPAAPRVSLDAMLKEPKSKSSLTPLERTQLTALSSAPPSPRDKSQAEKMREGAKKSVIYHAEHDLAQPGTRGHALAGLIVKQFEKDPDLVPILDEVDPARLGWNNAMITLAKRFVERKRMTEQQAISAAQRVASAKVVVGDWPPGLVTMPRTLDPKKMSWEEEVRDALRPQVEIVGFNRRGQTITPRAEGRVEYFFRRADVVGGALSGLVEGLSQGKFGEDLGRSVISGIREGKIALDATDAISVNQEWARENPLVMAKLKAYGVGLTVMMPDLTLLGGPIYRAGKFATRFARAAPTLQQAARLQNQAHEGLLLLRGSEDEQARGAEIFQQVENTERKLRDKAPAFRDSVSMEEARLAEKDLDAGDEFGIADEQLALDLGKYNLPVPRLITMNPAFRRKRTEVAAVQLQDFKETFGLGAPYKALLERLRELEQRADTITSREELAAILEEATVVERALDAIDRNVQLRLKAFENTSDAAVALATKGTFVAGRAAARSESRMFGEQEATTTRRAIDVIGDEISSLRIEGLRFDREAKLQEIIENGNAVIPDADKTRALRARADDLNESIADAANMGASPAELEPLKAQLRATVAQLRQGPEKRITANDLAELQDQLELASKPRTGLVGPGLVERGDMPVGETPVEGLERAVEGLAKWGTKDRGLSPMAQKTLEVITNIPSVVKSFAFGLDADSDLRKLTPEFIKRIKAGIRYIDQSASDFNRLIRDGDEAAKIDYLIGNRVKFANGQRASTSGYDFVARMQNRINQKFYRLPPEQAERLRSTLERIDVEGMDWLIDMSPEDAKPLLEDMKEFWVGDELLDEIYRITGRRPGAGVENVTLNPPEIDLMETLLYYSGAIERSAGQFRGGSREAVEEILRKVDALYGRKTKGARDAVAQSIGVLGNVDEVMRGWTATKTAVPENLQAAYADLLQGKAIRDPQQRAEVMRLAEEAGLGAAFTTMLDIAGTDVYIPAAARQRIIESLDRVLSRGRVGKEVKTSGYNALQETVQLTKAVYTRGGIITRPKYFHQNSMDRFSQLAIEAGFGPALVNTARQAAIELTTIPGVENIIRLLGKDKGEKARDILQAGNVYLPVGDRLANVLNKLFGAGGTRIEVNKILDGTDDVIMVGDKAYTGKVLQKVFVEEGAESSFDNTALRQVIMTRRKAMDLGPLDPSLVNDMAESISVRERYGAAVTLIEQRGMEPRDAIRLANKAYYDYATSVAKQESSSTGLGLALTTVEPYWAYKKNATRQIFNALLTPEAAYRMMIIRRATQEGADIVTRELYESETDRYGVQVDALPEQVRSDYFALKLAIDKQYNGKVPEGVEESIRAIANSGHALHKAGRYKELTASGGIQQFVKDARLGPISAASPPRPDDSAYRGYLTKRAAVGITPDMSDPAIQEYFANQSGSRSHLALVLPEDTIHAGLEHMAHVALIMAGTGVAMADPSVDSNDILQWAGEYWDMERAPVVGGVISAVTGGQGGKQRISKTMAEMLREEGYYTDGEVARWGMGPAEGQAYYLPEGLVARGIYNPAFRSADEFLKRLEGTPMLNAMGRKGDILKLISATRGYTFTEGQRERTAEQDLRRKRIEMRANIE